MREYKVPTPGFAVEVNRIPSCDLCGDNTPAKYDANIGRGWGNVCTRHFLEYGCSLGVGVGQQLLLRGSSVGFNLPSEVEIARVSRPQSGGHPGSASECLS